MPMCVKSVDTFFAIVFRLAAIVKLYNQGQGRHHEVLIGGGGVVFIGTKTYLPPKFSFSSDFGHFIWKMLENTKN